MDTTAVDRSKRNFLKCAGVTAGVTGALAFLGSELLPEGNSYLVSTAAAATTTGDPKGEWHYSYCRMCMRGDCGIRYKVVNNVLMEVKGNEASPTNKGALCPRGLALIQNRYNPYRVKAPLKRTNPKKGINEDPGWVEISWDEALDTVAKKFRAIYDTDPRGLLVNVGFGGMDYFTTFLPYFMAAFRSPNTVATNGPLCSVHYATELVQACFPVALTDLAYCDYHISLGRSISSNIAAANGETRALADYLARGKKLVVVDPRCSPEASKGEWVPIRPGGDLPFVLGLIHSVLYEIKTLDTDFLVNRTNGPYLIGADGAYFRNPTGKPQVIDSKSSRIRPFDDPAITPLLEGETQTPSGTVTTGFTLMKRAMKEYTPEWTEKQSTIPAATIRRIAREFVEHARIGATINLNGTVMPLRPASITCARGSCNHQDGTVMDLATKILNELVGALDVPGGCLGCLQGPVLKPDEDGTVTPFFEAVGVPFTYPPQTMDLAAYFPFRHSMPHVAYKVMLEPEKYGVPYRIQGALLVGGNTVNGTVQPDLMAKALASVPFVASIAYNYDENVALSDIVLPDHAMLERMDVHANITSFGALTDENLGLRMVLFRDPLPPTYNTRQSQDIVLQLFQRMHLMGPLCGVMNGAGIMMGEVRGMVMARLPDDLKLSPGQPFTMADIWDRSLKAYVGRDKGVDWFRKNGVWSEYVPREQSYNYFYYPMGKTRFQIYFEGLRAGGQKLRQNLEQNHVVLPGVDLNQMLAFYDAIPRWRETTLTKDMKEGEKAYDLLAFNFKVANSNFRLGGQDQLPWLMEVGDKLDPYYNTVCMNPRTAVAKGFRDGQAVWVESKWGKIRGRVKTSELFHPETVGLAGALGRMVNTLGKQPGQRLHYNRLLGAELGTMDPIAGGVENTVRVKVYAA